MNIVTCEIYGQTVLEEYAIRLESYVDVYILCEK